MMSKITILHLSDIHFKRNEKETFREDVQGKMIAAIKMHREKYHMEPDFIAVTGDIAFSGKEYTEAKVFFRELKSVLPTKTRFLVVPGNHDLDREKISKFFSLHYIVQRRRTDALKDLWLIYGEELKNSEKIVVFEDLLKLYLEKIKCKLTWEIAAAFLARQKALFLIDGLDEVPGHLRANLVNMLAQFQFDCKENRFLITGRPHGITGEAEARFGSDLHEIAPLDEPKIDDFIKKWFRAISGRAAGLGEVTAEGMISDIRQHEHISAFTQNPLLLTAVCILYQDGKRIPEQRADLYNRIIDNLIHRRFNDPSQPGKESEILEFLMTLAFAAQKNHLKTIEIADALEILRNIFPRRGRRPRPLHGQSDVVLSEASSQNLGSLASFDRTLVKEEEERQSHYRQRILKLL